VASQSNSSRLGSRRISDGFRQFLEDQFAPVGGVSLRAMFGGLGVFRGGIMFALVADETLYLRVDGGNRPDFEAEGSEPFTYVAKGKPMAMSYWQAPERLFDDPDEFIGWAEKAIAAAGRAAAARKPFKKR
jgi:DNA transformation protein